MIFFSIMLHAPFSIMFGASSSFAKGLAACRARPANSWLNWSEAGQLLMMAVRVMVVGASYRLSGSF